MHSPRQLLAAGLGRLLRSVRAEFPGRWRLEHLAVREIRRLGPTLVPVVVMTHDGFRMWADPGEWVGQYIYATGRYEEKAVAVMKGLLRPGDTVVDVGANVGYLTLVAARQVGPTGSVTAFEPLPSARSWLARNVALNGFGNVTIREEAVCDRHGTASFTVGPAHHTSTSSLMYESGDGSKVEVRCTRLDDVLEGAAAVRLLKIDVEGAEGLVLDGARETLTRHAPAVIIELNSDGPIETLRALGYDGRTLDNREIGVVTGQANAVFTRNG